MEAHDYRSIFISDIHLGTKGCQADVLLSFLKRYTSNNLYLIGDIVDGWQVNNGFHWPQEHTNIIRRFLTSAKRGTKVTYVLGNHDEALRKYLTYDITFGDISIVDECVHYGIDKRKYLVTHGDHYDKTMEYPWLSYFGDRAYNYAIWVSRQLNRLRRLLKLPYWSFSGMLKQKAKGYLEYLYEFESQVARHAQIRNFDGVICGHTHTAKIVEINDMIYMNDGDWVDSCTAIVEHHDGNFEIISWREKSKQLNLGIEEFYQ